MNQIVIISESETDIHVHIDGDNIDILKGIALILREMDANGLPLASTLEYLKSEASNDKSRHSN